MFPLYLERVHLCYSNSFLHLLTLLGESLGGDKRGRGAASVSSSLSSGRTAPAKPRWRWPESAETDGRSSWEHWRLTICWNFCCVWQIVRRLRQLLWSGCKIFNGPQFGEKWLHLMFSISIWPLLFLHPLLNLTENQKQIQITILWWDEQACLTSRGARRDGAACWRWSTQLSQLYLDRSLMYRVGTCIASQARRLV